MKSKKLLTLLASVALAISSIGGISVIVLPQSVKASQNIEYYLLDHDTTAYDSNGNIEVNTTVSAGFKFYSNMSTIKNINGKQFIEFHEIYVPLNEVKPVYVRTTTNNQLTSGTSTSINSDNKASSKISVSNVSNAKNNQLYNKVGNKYGLVKKITIPKLWRGKYYSYISKKVHGYLSLWKHGTHTAVGNSSHARQDNYICTFWEPGLVKGTNKYPWQMSKKWQNSKYNYLKNNMTAKARWHEVMGYKCIELSSVCVKPSSKNNYSNGIIVHNEWIKGKKVKVLFGVINCNSKPKVEMQSFKSLKLSKKYAHYKFSGMQYSSYFKY